MALMGFSLSITHSFILNIMICDDSTLPGAGPLSKFLRTGKGKGSNVLSESFIF